MDPLFKFRDSPSLTVAVESISLVVGFACTVVSSFVIVACCLFATVVQRCRTFVDVYSTETTMTEIKSHAL